MEHLSEIVADFYIKRNIIEADDKEIYQYGVFLILNEVFTFLLIFILSILMKKFRFSLEFLIPFCVTRIFCGGFHAKKVFICRFTMISTFLFIVVLSYILINISNLILIEILALSFVILLPFIPVRHPNKTLSEELIKKNKICGIISFILFSVIAILTFIFINRQDGIMITLSLTAVTVLAIVGSLRLEGGTSHEKVNR